MRPNIKICCVRTVEEAKVALAAGADAIGMVGAIPPSPSPRTISDAEIATIARAVPAQVRTYVLSTARSAEEIAAQAARTH
jgi:phosphoribosylanthranilate isomerase